MLNKILFRIFVENNITNFMKKQFSLLLGLLMAFSTLFVSCNEENICKITVMSEGDGVASISGHIGTSANVLKGNFVEIVATPADGCTFLGWYVGDLGILVSEEERFVFTASEDLTFVARFKGLFDTSGAINGHHYVDLGLSVKWATCNVGASNLEDYGGYYAWGETEEKENYAWSTYKWSTGVFNSITKYNHYFMSGVVDNKDVLDSEDDVAHVKWGGGWRTPTYAEFTELCNLCTWQWVTVKGINGYRVTGPNGNSIFLPAAGCCSESVVELRGNNGYYMTNLNDKGACNYSYALRFINGSYSNISFDRSQGHSVRPVCE